MVVVARASFPRRHLKQVVAAYTGLPPLPPGIIKNGPLFQPGEEAVQVLTFYNLSDGDADKLIPILRERYSCFAQIPDFDCDLQEWREFREFLSGWME
jgi:hypothetical protein